MEQNFLPNDSIVLLNQGKKKLMIYGRRQLLVKETTKEYDYIGVMYPEGYISPEYSNVFNQEDIAEVIFKGYQDEEEEEFHKLLKVTE
ncbi:hypothetical protein JOD45_002532 [Scopulibacillus daqui]|uniref:DUF4176 domain-containing protein n=1 Tax=Scopulibacillus daqui TaxID=1469162 RepID=A0ABS2Q1X8_9BACL|nr:hypothetical protein [Scopulibacillus daqui]